MSILTIISICLGVALLLFTWFDLFMTVFMIGGGAGPQSRLVADRSWRLALRLHSPGSDTSHSFMRAVGPTIVLLALATWVLELIIGWALIFGAEIFMEPWKVSIGDRLIFAGKSIVGRSGNSPALKVDQGMWEAIQSFAGLSGVVIVSVGLAYVLPILASVAHKRSIAATMHSLGDGVDDMVDLAKTGDGGSISDQLIAMIPGIALCAERHRSYPVLHYFHSQDPHAALAPAIAKIALLLKSDLSDVPTIDRTVSKPLAHAIHNLIDAFSGLGLKRYALQEDTIDKDKLGELNINPRTPPPDNRMPETEWLKAYVQFDGWDWDAIEKGSVNTNDPQGKS